ncbi:lipopolysaccharide biosynthesis protein [Microbacteriaceae bacterium 4G12]
MRKQFALMLVARSMASIIQVVALLVLARVVEPAALGAVSAIVGIGAFLSALLDFGVGTFLLKLRALTPADPRIHAALRLNDLTSVVLGVVVTVLALLFGIDPVPAVLLAVWILLDKNTDTQVSVATADGRMGPVTAIVLGRRVLGIVAFVALLLAGMEPVLAFALGQTVGAVYGVVHGKLTTRAGLTRADRFDYAGVIRDSRHFWVAVLSAQVRELDVAIISVAASGASGGLYSVAMRLSKPATLFASSLASVILPSAARGGAAVARRNGRTIVWLALGSAVLGGLLWPLMPWLVILTAGDAYADATLPAQVLLVAMGFIALCSPLGSLLQSQHHERFVAANGVVFGVLTVLGLFVGALAGQATGAAIALGVVYLAKFVSLSLRLSTVTRDAR